MARLSDAAMVAVRVYARNDPVIVAALAEALEESFTLAEVARRHGLAPRTLRKRRDAFRDVFVPAWEGQGLDDAAVLACAPPV